MVLCVAAGDTLVRERCEGHEKLMIWRQSPAILVGAETRGPGPRLEASLLHAAQSCLVPGDGLVFDQGKELHRCWEVLKLRHKSQAQTLWRGTTRSPDAPGYVYVWLGSIRDQTLTEARGRVTLVP